MDLPGSLFAGGGERFQEALPVQVIVKDGLAMVPAVHHVINRARILEAQLASHVFDRILPGWGLLWQPDISISLTFPKLSPKH